jgi:transcriptional regulator with XRE-family HTH domain
VGKPNPIREFLTTRRARLSPEQVGVRSYGTRRVPGLRREEVAGLAGISVEYYTQLERGNVAGASEDVLEAVTRALQLDDVERSHLFDLVHTARQERRRRAPVAAKIGPYARQVLEAIPDAAAFIRNGRLDILATNRVAAVLYADAFADAGRPVNLARFVFLDLASQRFYRAWDQIADQTVGSLRAEVGRDPDDEHLRALIGELTMRSDDFAQRWATHDVRQYRSGTQPFHHATIGDIDLAYEALELVSAPGQTLVVYTAEPGSPSERALRSLVAPLKEGSTVDPAEAPTGP